MEEQILPETNSPEKKRAPISRHARLYFLILSVVVILSAWFSNFFFTQSAEPKTLISVRTVGMVEHNQEIIFDREDGDYDHIHIATPAPSPTTEVSWKGNEKTIDYHNGLKKIETYGVSKEGKDLISKFSLSVAVMVAGVGILIFFLIKNIQLKKKKSLISVIVIMTAWLVGYIFVSLWIHKELNDSSNFESDGDYGVMYIDG